MLQRHRDLDRVVQLEEFADKDGRPYALLPFATEKLIVLQDEPQFA